MSNTERVRKWRAEQRRKAQLYDQLEAARRVRLHLQAAAMDEARKEFGDFIDPPDLERSLADPLCFDILFAKA